MNREKIVNWLKLNNKKLIGLLMVILVLVGAFWYGGDTDDSHGFKVKKNNSKNVTTTIEELSDEKNADKDKASSNKEKETTTTDETEKEENIANSDNSQTVSEDSNNQSQGESVENESADINAEISNNQLSTQEPQLNPQSSGQSMEQNAGNIESQTTNQPSNTTDSEEKTCTISISCATILNNMDKLEKDKKSIIPSDGWILKPISVKVKDGDTVFDILKRVCRDKKIHMEFANTPMYGSNYIEGIYNLYEFDCGSLSGWMFSVNGEFANYGSSKIAVNNGDEIKWVYTCDLGNDVK